MECIWLIVLETNGEEACCTVSCWDNSFHWCDFFLLLLLHNSSLAKTKQLQDCILDRQVNTCHKLFHWSNLAVPRSESSLFRFIPPVFYFKLLWKSWDCRCQITRTKPGSQGNAGDNCICWMIKRGFREEPVLWKFLVYFNGFPSSFVNFMHLSLQEN